MADTLRLWFLAFYAVGVAILVAKVIPALWRAEPGEMRVTDRRRYLPALLLPFHWALPPLVVFFRVGELQASWPAVRLVGFLLSLYAALMLLWVSATMGRFLVPQAVVYKDHRLFNGGPFRIVRHPAYSGDLALWLGAALGTLNPLLLALWPVAAVGTAVQARAEEQLLRERFGSQYENYAQATGRLVPRWPTRT